MANGEQQGALELTEQEELELRQLAELILETTVSEELFQDLRELSEPVLSIVRSGSKLEFWSTPSGEEQRSAWASFDAYSALDEILRELLLGDRDENADPELEDAELQEAAESYGSTGISRVTLEELGFLQSVLQDKLSTPVELNELEELLGDTVPDFIEDARSHSWSDPAVVEAATNFYLNGLSEDALGVLVDGQPLDHSDSVFLGQDLKSIPEHVKEQLSYRLLVGTGEDSLGEDSEDSNEPDHSISEEERESFLQDLGELIEDRVRSIEQDLEIELEEEIPEDYAPRALTDVEELVVNDPEIIEAHEQMETHPELYTVADDLSPSDDSTDTSDEGEWGVAEIAGEGESEDDEDFAVEEIDGEDEEDHIHHGPHGHVHQILGDELRSPDDYDGEPADERESATLALIAEGIIATELSEILLQDLLAEADPLIRKSRALGPDWWLTIDAADDVANLLSRLLLGKPWPVFAPNTSDEVLLREGNAHQSQLKLLAESYPLDPEPSWAELIGRSSLSERLALLLEARGERSIEPSESELRELREVIEGFVGVNPTDPFVADLSSLLDDDAMDEVRAWGFHRTQSAEVLRLSMALLLGAVAVGDPRITISSKQREALQAAVQSYKTEELTEEEFLQHYDQSRWPSVGATVDLSIFTVLDGELQVLLIERGNHPEKGKWALPGGFVDIGESLDAAALRELQEETGVDLSEGGSIEQVRTYGYPGRDPRGYIISTLYAALIPEAPAVLAGDDAAKARFVPVETALSGELELAFDHAGLLRDALERVRAKLEYAPVAFSFLEEDGFTLEELRELYETVWGFELVPSDFVRRISQAQGALAFLGEVDGRQLWSRGPANSFFPPLDRAQVLRQR